MTTSSCLDRLRGFLQERDVHYEVNSHPHVETTQEAAAVGGISGYQFAKSVVLMVDGAPHLFVLPAAARIDLDAVRRDMDATQVAVAAEHELQPLFPGCSQGAIPAIPMATHIPVHIEREFLGTSHIVFEAGSSTDAIRMRFYDYMRLVQPTPGHFAQHPRRRTGGGQRRRAGARTEWADLQPSFERAAVAAGVLAIVASGWRLVYLLLPTHTLRTFFAGLAFGAFGATLMDPRSGARRRALVRDRSARLMRRSNWWVSRKGRYWRGKVEGVRHRIEPVLRRERAA